MVTRRFLEEVALRRVTLHDRLMQENLISGVVASSDAPTH